MTSAALSRTGNRLEAAVCRANTTHHALCRSGRDEAADAAMSPLMNTDSERLLHEGIATGVATLKAFYDETGWSPDDVDKTVCHQVGRAHQKLMQEALDIDPRRDFVTYPFLGNTGSAALPVTLAIGLDEGHIGPGDHVGLFGIGSGINCIMLAVAWQRTLVASAGKQTTRHSKPLAVV